MIRNNVTFCIVSKMLMDKSDFLHAAVTPTPSLTVRPAYQHYTVVFACDKN